MESDLLLRRPESLGTKATGMKDREDRTIQPKQGEKAEVY
jgi:hypothetical protein